MPTQQNISNFYQTILTREFSRDFLFRVLSVNLRGTSVLNETDLIYAKTATLPGRNITNIPTKFMGLQFNLAGVATYPGSDSFTVKFFCDANSSIRNRLIAETRAVFDELNGSTGDYNTPGLDSTIVLMQLDKQLNPVTRFNLIGASIRDVGIVNYNMSDGIGTPVDFDVKFSYHYFTQA